MQFDCHESRLISSPSEMGQKAEPVGNTWSPFTTCLLRPDTARFANPIIGNDRLSIQLPTERKVGMGVQCNPICTREDVCPHRQRCEPVVDGNVWPFARTITSNAPYYVVGVEVTTSDVTGTRYVSIARTTLRMETGGREVEDEGP
jgi:hypothetical protein